MGDGGVVPGAWRRCGDVDFAHPRRAEFVALEQLRFGFDTAKFRGWRHVFDSGDGRAMGRFGSKRVSVLTSTAFCLSLVLPALALNALTLAVALYVYGAVAAAMDVAMNAQAVEVEKAMERPTMSRFHGMFSLGAMLGAAAGGAVAARGIGVVAHFAVSGAVNVVAVLAVGGLLLDTHDPHTNADHRLPFRKMPRVLVALSAIGFCILLSEGAIADWTALYLKQVLKAGQGTAAVGYQSSQRRWQR